MGDSGDEESSYCVVSSCFNWAMIRVKFGLCEASLYQQFFITWYTWSGQSSGCPRCTPWKEQRNSSQQFADRLRIVPHLSSGIVERAKRERAWKSPHARKGDTRREERKWFSRTLAFRSLYYPWEKMGDYSWSSLLIVASGNLATTTVTAELEPLPRTAKKKNKQYTGLFSFSLFQAEFR